MEEIKFNEGQKFKIYFPYNKYIDVKECVLVKFDSIKLLIDIKSGEKLAIIPKEVTISSIKKHLTFSSDGTTIEPVWETYKEEERHYIGDKYKYNTKLANGIYMLIGTGDDKFCLINLDTGKYIKKPIEIKEYPVKLYITKDEFQKLTHNIPLTKIKKEN